MSNSYYSGYKTAGNVEFVRTGYGKNIVKVLYFRREGKQHYIKEIEVNVDLTLKTVKDYIYGDNADVIPTDTMKNTVHALAKLKGIQTIEEFAQDICEHFLTSFQHVSRAMVHIEEIPWKRLEKDGVEHVHAFICNPKGTHFCEVEQFQNEPPVVHSGIKDMKVLKTTLSGFEGFRKDKFTTLPEARDRVFATVVYAKWRYSRTKNVNFDSAWKTVKDSIIEAFAGPCNSGVFSPSVQKTLYDAQCLSFSRIPEIEEIEVIMPNKHYFIIDMEKLGIAKNNEVLLPVDNPSGNITGTLRRQLVSKL
uniref:Uricase n=1 Tax=Callorhinchus milii TaxID=7868 RepID=A0A4W3HSP8_CALMI|eukprot:gi/632940599/ref/XP_007885405.1/ PREDICTED: uricase-like [Callorhinchus milii]